MSVELSVACIHFSNAHLPYEEAQVNRSGEQDANECWAEARIKIARMTLTIKLDGNWSSFQLANSAPPLSVTDSAIAPSARMVASLRQAGHGKASLMHW